MKQLVPPNTTILGKAGLCLAMQDDVWGAPHVYPSAHAAWDAAQFKHPGEQPPTDVSVICWWSYTGSDGVRYDHVASNVPGRGIYSSPFNTSIGAEWYPSIQAMTDRINKIPGANSSYLGWSEDISTLRVVQGEEDMTEDQLNTLHWLAMFSAPGDLWIKPLIGKSVDEALNSLRNDTPFKNDYRAAVEAQYNAGAQVPDLQKKIDDLTAANQKLVAQLQNKPQADPNSVTVTKDGLWKSFKKFLGLS